MAKKKPTAKKAIAKKGVKPGTKRGPYKQTKQKDEKTDTKSEEPENIKQANNTFNDGNSNTGLGDNNSNANTSHNYVDFEEVNNAEENTDDSEEFKKFQSENGAKEEFKELTPEEAEIKKVEAAKETQPAADVDDDGYKTVKRQFSDKTKRLITGRTLLNFCDIIIPGLMLTVFKFIDTEIKNSGIKRRDLKLDAEQREEMMPLADEVAAIIFDGIDPMTMFFIMLAVNYYGNMQLALSNSYQKNAA